MDNSLTSAAVDLVRKGAVDHTEPFGRFRLAIFALAAAAALSCQSGGPGTGLSDGTQCTDADADGLFTTIGCGSEIDCDD